MSLCPSSGDTTNKTVDRNLFMNLFAFVNSSVIIFQVSLITKLFAIFFCLNFTIAFIYFFFFSAHLKTQATYSLCCAILRHINQSSGKGEVNNCLEGPYVGFSRFSRILTVVQFSQWSDALSKTTPSAVCFLLQQQIRGGAFIHMVSGAI